MGPIWVLSGLSGLSWRLRCPDSPDWTQIGPIWAIRAFLAADCLLIAQMGPIWVLSGLSGLLMATDFSLIAQIGPSLVPSLLSGLSG